MNVEIGTEPPIFLFWEYLFRNFGILSLQCTNAVVYIPASDQATLQRKGQRIQYKCLVPIYVFPQMKLLFPRQNYNVLSPSSYTHISVRDLYNSRISLSILLQGNKWRDPGNIWIAHRHMNVEIWTGAAQFPEKEYVNGIFLAVHKPNFFSQWKIFEIYSGIFTRHFVKTTCSEKKKSVTSRWPTRTDWI